MALETLKGIGVIACFPVLELSSTLSPEDYALVSDGEHIVINHEKNSISFQIQKGPIRENGINGCQIDAMLAATLNIIEGLNHHHPHIKNDEAVEHITKALDALYARKKDRLERGVEGTNDL